MNIIINTRTVPHTHTHTQEDAHIITPYYTNKVSIFTINAFKYNSENKANEIADRLIPSCTMQLNCVLCCTRPLFTVYYTFPCHVTKLLFHAECQLRQHHKKIAKNHSRHSQINSATDNRTRFVQSIIQSHCQCNSINYTVHHVVGQTED